MSGRIGMSQLIRGAVATDCPECDEFLVGRPGAVGRCSYCGTWVDMPDDDLTDLEH